MFNYEKRLEYPIHIKETNPKLAKAIITQYGGPNGELGASMRYLSQRYTMPYKECAAFDSRTILNIHGGDRSVFGSHDLIFHLHGFQNQ